MCLYTVSFIFICSELAINKKADWVENLEAASESQRVKEERKIMGQEAALAGRSLVEVL